MHCKQKLLFLLLFWCCWINESLGNENLRFIELFESYCFDCHDEDVQKGNVNMAELFDAGSFDGTLMFENLMGIILKWQKTTLRDCANACHQG